MTDRPNSWRELFATGGIAVAVLVGGTAVQAMEGFITSAMLPTVVKDIGGGFVMDDFEMIRHV